MAFEPLEQRSLLAALLTGFVETPVAAGMANATAMEIAPNGDLWALEQGGAVKRFVSGSTAGDVVGNLAALGLSSSGERGVLGIAFDPQYATNKQVFIYYTATTPVLHNRISRFTVNDADPGDYFFVGASTSVADAGSAGIPTQTVIFDLDPLSGATNHNGGAIHFGPDGLLYVAVGDNANSANSQSLANVLGKMLRINSDGTIPSDNPFVASTSGIDQAIWALGLRNPFTFAFQPGTGRMFINDVGQFTWEEINEGLAGANYGWPNVEGHEGTPPAGPGTYVGPLYAYIHGSGPFAGFAITGGAFYNPSAASFPAQYVGDYFFADYVSDWINVLDVATGNVSQFATSAGAPVDLRVGADGSLFYLSRAAGEVLRVGYSGSTDVCPGGRMPEDVDADCVITPGDALLIINFINSAGARRVAGTSLAYLDVDGDGWIAPSDVLAIINWINAHRPGAPGPEGEAAAGIVASASVLPGTVDDWLLAALAADRPAGAKRYLAGVQEFMGFTA